MLYAFLQANRTVLASRCEAMRCPPRGPSGELPRAATRIPVFLDQLIEALRSPQGSDAAIVAEATLHGAHLLESGYSVREVAQLYRDLGLAILAMAREERIAVSSAEWETLTRLGLTAAAESVIEYERQRDLILATRAARSLNERLGFLAHELRNFLNTAILAFAAVKSGSVGLAGPTAGVIDRSLEGLRDLISRALEDVRHTAQGAHLEAVALPAFLAEVVAAASLAARHRECALDVSCADPHLTAWADRHLLHSAVENLLQNAFKFTRPHTCVSLRATGCGDRILVEVADKCGGLPQGKTEALFLSFTQHHADRSGLGLGLSIARGAVHSMGGTLNVRDLPGEGCVFTIELPRPLPPVPAAAAPGSAGLVR